MGTLLSLEDWLRSRELTVIAHHVSANGMVTLQLRRRDGSEMEVRWQAGPDLLFERPDATRRRRKRHRS